MTAGRGRRWRLRWLALELFAVVNFAAVRADQQAEDPGAVIDGYSCIERTTLHGEQECLSCPEQAPSRQSCADACDKRASCNTFVFGGGQCWLKANASTLVAFPGDEASCFKVGPFHKIGSGLCVDADGQHYRSARRSGYRVPWSCSLACEELGSNVCRGYSFFPLPGNAGMCVLAMDQFEHPDPHWVMDPRVGHHGAGPVARSTGMLGSFCFARSAGAPAAPPSAAGEEAVETTTTEFQPDAANGTKQSATLAAQKQGVTVGTEQAASSATKRGVAEPAQAASDTAEGGAATKAVETTTTEFQPDAATGTKQSATLAAQKQGVTVGTEQDVSPATKRGVAEPAQAASDTAEGGAATKAAETTTTEFQPDAAAGSKQSATLAAQKQGVTAGTEQAASPATERGVAEPAQAAADTAEGGAAAKAPTAPTSEPTPAPTEAPTPEHSPGPTAAPTLAPTAPTAEPTPAPTKAPTPEHSPGPTAAPTLAPTAPTAEPTPAPTKAPTAEPTPAPTAGTPSTTRSSLRSTSAPPAMQRAVSSQSDGGAQESAAAGQNAGQPLGNQRHPIVRVCSGTQQELAACSGLPACFSDCQPVDCAWNDWQDWYGLGGCTGLCVHDRTIKTVNNECGRPCNGSKRETIQRDDCMPSSCKVASADCTWEEWSGWSSCSSGQQYRTRGILGVPSGRGKACDGPYHQVRPCVLAPAQDCQLSEWGDWAKCSTLCGGGMQVRARRIAIHRENGGSPCSGAMSEAQMCNDVPCSSSAPECELSDWGEWKACDGLATQTARVRAVLPPEAGGVSECRLPGNASAPLQEIKPCTPNDNVARSKCELSLWSEWGACSGSCSGQRSRSRGMLGSLNDGLVCELPSDQATLEVEPCGEHSCLGGAEKCELSDWADWSPCSRMCGEGMAERSRSVTRQGPSCAVSLKDVKACSLSNCTVVDCKLGDWEQWGTCTTTCGGGLMERKRGVASLPRHGGRECEAGSMSEAAACGTQPCRTCIDGAWGQWGNWSACTGSCSPAYRVRRREVEKHPNECGKHATGLEDEYGLCAGLPPCKPDRDCELSAWSEWSACSSTCRGTRQRNRNVKVFQSGEGRKCNAESLQETSPCSPGPGEDAPEGCRAEARQSCQLAAWSPWGDCSQTCGGGQAQRSRFVLVPSDEGGEPCSDSLSEVKKCLSNPCNQSLCQDCEWEQWSDWSECPASSCAGQKYRRRAIRRAPNFCGRPCNESHSKETAPCDSTCAGEGAPAFYCAWSGWADMGGCVAECGATTRLRSRNLQLLPAVAGNGSALLTAAAALFASPGGYVACSGAQTAQEHCLLPPCDGQCEPVDCVFSDWKDWGAATDNLLCERQRDIVRMHDCGGKLCSGSLSQTERCTEGTAGLQDCVLSDWSAWEPPGACEANTQRSRKRTVELQPAGGGRACEGALQETTSCRDVPADGARADCQLGPWGEWSTCSSSCGPGTRNRARSTTLATGGGRPCEGSLQEQGPCVTACEASPCELSEWAEWGACSNQRLRLRNRTLLREAASGGAPCQGNLEEVAGCRLVDCEVSPWAEWSACDRACDGQQQRSRDVVVEPSMGGQCTRSLQETRGCSQDSCEDTYTLGDWEDWGACTDISCGIGRRQRRRSTCERSKDEGCKGTLAELQPCSTNGTVETSRRLHQSYGDEECPTPQDCAWGDWDEWSECSCSCNGGHHYRTREVVAMPSHGGRACEALSSEQAQPCNTQPCGSEHCADGEWDDWLSWAPCSSTCEGTTWRNRNLLREPDPCGRPAAGPSMQHASCNADIPCANHSRVDCRLAQWADWSDCDAACYGLARRHRTVEVHRRGGGEPCEGSLRQVRSCPNGPECAVDAPEDRDCSLSEWADWGACTNPCGGQRTRSRSVLLPPSGKGAPCEQGLALSALEPCEESQSCLSAPDVDCRWGSWGEWGACSGCDGQRQRSRHIEQVATGLGRPCEAAQSEEITNCTRSCHYVPGTFCGWVDWGPWTPCSATCGQGSRQRSRRLGTLHENSTLDMPAYIQKYDGLVARAERLRAHRLREILVAFVAGSLSVVAMLSAVQRAGSRWRCLQRRAEAVRVSLYNTVPEPVITAVQCVSNATRSFSRTSEFGHARYLALSTEDQDEGWFQGPAE